MMDIESIIKDLRISFKDGKCRVLKGSQNFNLNLGVLEGALKEAYGRQYVEQCPNMQELFDCLQSMADESKAPMVDGMGPAAFMEDLWNSMKIQIDDNGIWTYDCSGSRLDLTISDFISRAQMDLKTLNMALSHGEKIPDAAKQWTEWMLREKQSGKMRMWREAIRYEVPDFNVQDFVRGFFAEYLIPVTMENITMFLHMIWSIKRNAFYQDVPYPIFFSLHGSQGIGKTYAISKIVAPHDWAYSGQGLLSDLLIAKDAQAMVRNRYLIDFQEISVGRLRDKYGNLDDVAVAKLKSAITSDVISGRVMYTAAQGTERNTATFISSTNYHIFDMIPDPSGMRRYWEFHSKLTLKDIAKNPAIFSRLNKYIDNFICLFKAIDENDDYGYFHPERPGFKEIRSIQDSYLKENSILRFLEKYKWELTEPEDPSASTILVKDFTRKYNTFLRAEEGDGTRPWSWTKIEQAIRLLKDVAISKIEKNGEIQRVYYIREEGNK